MNTHLKVITQRIKYLRDTAKELKNEFKKTKNPLLEDLYLEIQCYCDIIECHTK